MNLHMYRIVHSITASCDSSSRARRVGWTSQGFCSFSFLCHMEMKIKYAHSTAHHRFATLLLCLTQPKAFKRTCISCLNACWGLRQLYHIHTRNKSHPIGIACTKLWINGPFTIKQITHLEFETPESPSTYMHYTLSSSPLKVMESKITNQ